MITDRNTYYKSILERITHTEITGTHNDNYYIKRISEAYGRQYNKIECSNVYLRNWAEDIYQSTFPGKKYNNFFLHKIAEYLTGTTYTTHNDIYFLDIILNNINYTTLTTSLTINVPVSLVYTDEFNITGVLKDEENNVLSNKQVHLIVGSTIVDTQRTNSQGEVSFTTAPVSMGTHTFSLSFDGEGVYSSCTSTEVTRVIGKETSVLQLDMGTNPVFYTDSDLLADGVLTTDDGEAITGKSILLVQDNTTISSAVTDSNGEFSMDLSSLSVGSAQSVSFVFSDDSYYTDSVVPVSVTIREASLSIVSDKDILSFVDDDSATLTAHYVSGDVEGKTVSFNVFKVSDDSLVESLSDDTDASGLASVSYSSKGTGDLYIQCECMSLQEIYDVQDCYRYDDASSDKTSRYGSLIAYRSGGSGTWNYNSTNGYYGIITGDNEVMVELPELTGKDDFTIEFDALLNANDNGFYGLAGICAYENNNNYSRLSCHNKTIAQRVCVNGSANESESNVLTTVSRYDILHYRFTISNNQIIEEVTRGTTLIGTRTISYTPTSNTKYGIGLIWGINRVKDTFLKNIKVKLL